MHASHRLFRGNAGINANNTVGYRSGYIVGSSILDEQQRNVNTFGFTAENSIPMDVVATWGWVPMHVRPTHYQTQFLLAVINDQGDIVSIRSGKSQDYQYSVFTNDNGYTDPTSVPTHYLPINAIDNIGFYAWSTLPRHIVQCIDDAPASNVAPKTIANIAWNNLFHPVGEQLCGYRLAVVLGLMIGSTKTALIGMTAVALATVALAIIVAIITVLGMDPNASTALLMPYVFH